MRLFLAMLSAIFVSGGAKFLDASTEESAIPKNRVGAKEFLLFKSSPMEKLKSANYEKEEKKAVEEEFVMCVANVGGETFLKKCTVPEDGPSDMGLACYSLWHGDSVTQDCWIHQEVSLEQCQQSKCESEPTAYGVNFCCCFGHECNAKYSVQA